MTPSEEPLRLLFGDFELDIANARLRRGGEVVELAPKSFELLVCLASRAQTLVAKDELLDTVWGRRFVSEGAVKTVVSELRAALGDDARTPRWIETVQRRGYRFIGAVRPDGPAAATGPTALPDSPGAVSSTASALATMPPKSTSPGNLPPPGPPPFGRDEDIDALTALLDGASLVTLTGPGGVGKSCLALAVAQARRDRHPDGVWWVSLAPLAAASTDAEGLRGALARALRIAPLGTGSDAELQRALARQRMLIVLDNAEHLLDVLVPWLAAWAPGVDGLRVLVTSREALQLSGEQVWRVAPLPVPGDDDPGAADSAVVGLFTARVAARMQGFVPGPGHRQSLLRICRALDGLPLALELGAARVPVLGVHGLAEQLDDADAGHRLKLLTQGTRTALPHQRTLRATLDWSHALLTPNEQRVLRRLSVFRGGFTAATAREVATTPGEDPWATLDALAALTDKSMLVAPAPGAAEARIGLLESVREYAAERLEAAGEAHAAARRHLGAMAALFTAAEGVAMDEPQLQWLARMEPELDNLRAALRWAVAHADDPSVADATLDLVTHSARFLQRLGLAAEAGRNVLAMRAQAERQADPRRRAALHIAIATLCRFTPMLSSEENLALARSAAETYEALGDRLQAYLAHYLSWALALEIGEHVERASHLERMQALAEPDWGILRRRWVRSAWAQDQRLLGNRDAFLQASRDDFAALRQIGAQAESWMFGTMLMLAEHDRGELARALAVGESVLADIRAAGRLRGHAQLLAMHTAMRADAGDVAGTRAALNEALPSLGTTQATDLLWLAIAWLAAHEGRHEDAARVLGWFASSVRGGGSFGPRTFTHRSSQALAARLDAELGAGVRPALTAAAADLGDAEALRIGLRRPPGEPGPADPGRS